MTGESDALNMYVFGGRLRNGSRTNELWRFDPLVGDWTNMNPAGALPSARQSCATAFDLGRGVLVVFGGRTDAGIDGETWEWNLGTNTWSNVTPAVPNIGVNTPPELENATMVYESALGRCLMFGGRGNGVTASSEVDETWAWDGASWTRLSPASAPPARRNHAMGYDMINGIGMVWGGIDPNRVALGDTWLWDGADWTQVVTATIPFANGANNGSLLNRVVYDGVRGRFVLTSGVYPGGVPTTLNETYEFDGTDWINRGVGGISSRFVAAVAHVLSTGKTYSYGGFNGVQIDGLFEYQTDMVATFTSNGTTGLSCPSSTGAGTPQISAQTLPWIGESLDMTVTNLSPTATIRAMLLNLAAPPAPINLAILGEPACNLLAGPSLSLPLVGSTLSLAMPTDLVLAGASIHLQAVTVEAVGPGPILDIAGSERADAVIGVL